MEKMAGREVVDRRARARPSPLSINLKLFDEREKSCSIILVISITIIDNQREGNGLSDGTGVV